MQKLALFTSLTGFASTLLVSCTTPDVSQENSTTNSNKTNNSASGTLALVANGEDFVRQGFVSKDGWRIDFDHVYVTLAQVSAYQSDPPFTAKADSKIQAQETIILVSEPTTVDLATGDENAPPIFVTAVDAPVGSYNALSWKLIPAEEGVAAGNTIVLDGTATKAEQTLNFTIKINQPLAYTCGEFIGEARKGILKGDKQAEVETTFHFDHIFGDAEAAVDDEINTGALGFQPLANLAQGETIEVSSANLKANLDSSDYQILEQAILSLGHVGEGHCL